MRSGSSLRLEKVFSLIHSSMLENPGTPQILNMFVEQRKTNESDRKNNVKAAVSTQNRLQKDYVCLVEVDNKCISNITITREIQKFMFHVCTFKLQ